MVYQLNCSLTYIYCADLALGSVQTEVAGTSFGVPHIADIISAYTVQITQVLYGVSNGTTCLSLGG